MADIVRIGTLSSPYTNHTYNLKLELTLLEQDITNNRSKVRLRQYAYSTSTTYQAYSGSTTNPYWVKINGANVVSGTKAMDFRNKAIVELGTYEGWVNHGSNGQLTIAVSSGFEIYGPSSLSGGSVPSYNWVLTTIPRYVVITSFYANSITRNSFKLNYATDKAVSEVQYSTDGVAWAAFPSTGVFSGSANAVYSMRIRVKSSESGLWTESSAITVTLVKTAAANTPTLSSNTCIHAVISWTATQTVTEVQYKIGSGAWVSAGTFTARTSGSFTVAGLTPGAAVIIYVRVKDAVHSVLSAQSSGRSVTTVALSSVSSAADFNLESDLAVTISRPSTSLVHDLTLEAYYDSAWNAVAINTAQLNKTTSGSLSPTSAAVSTLFSKTPTVKSLSVRIKIVVRWGTDGTIQGTVYKSGAASIVNANPSIASVSYLDTSSAVQAILANDQKILRNKSSLKVVAGTAASQKGAILANYKVTIGGSNYSVNAVASVTTESGKEITVGTVNQSANQTVVITVTDSRGNTATRSFTVQMLDYQDPQILQAVPQRLNSYEAPTTMIVEGRRYTVKPSTVDVNEVYVRYRLKENPSGAYGAWITLTRSNGSISGLWQAIAVDQYMADYPNTKSYTVELQISDNFTTWVSTFLELSEGIAILRMMKEKMLSGVDLELLNNKGIILESTNGTRYILKVNDSGVITTVIA